jgi:thioredoxin 2
MPTPTPAANIVCPRCHKTNRVPAARRDEEPRCGACKEPLFGQGPIALDDSSFVKHAERSDIPLLVDFWAAWCGPCRLMAPAFERAAADWEGRVRFAKVDTDASPGVSQRFRIQSIPTLILFQGGREVARTSGALSADQIQKWLVSQRAA